MGGDNAPEAIVEGTVAALEADFVKPSEVVLVGREDAIREHLTRIGAEDAGVAVLHAEQIVQMHESPWRRCAGNGNHP